MQQERLEVQKRGVFGKGPARELRRSGRIPAILYGRGQDVLPLQIDQHYFRQFLRAHGENVLINLEVADHGTEVVMIKEIQRDPVVKRTLLHADFIRISLEEPVTASVTIILVGTATGVSQDEGILEFPHRELHVHCLPTLLPESIEVDVSELNINDFIHVGDLSLAEGIEVLDDSHTVITTVSPPRVVEEVTEEIEGEEEGVEQAEETPEEPELISRRRSTEEDEE